MGQRQFARGEAGEKGWFQKQHCDLCIFFRLLEETSGLNLVYFEITFQLVDCVSLSETLP